MAHRPYPLYYWGNDFWWVACFASVALLSLRVNAEGRKLFWAGGLLLMFSRIWLASLAGFAVVIEGPLLLAMDFYSIGYVVWPKRFERHAEQVVPPNSH